MRKASVAQTLEQRNQAKLCEALQEGSHVIRWIAGGGPPAALVRSKSDPKLAYIVTRRHNPATGATTETCTCPAMHGTGDNSYIKAVVRWHSADGTKHNNGVVPCSHILIARFDRQWLAADPPMRAIILASTPGLEAAIAANGYYSVEA